MKRYVAAWLMVFLFVTLTGCSSGRNVYLSRDYGQETWQRNLVSNPHIWKQNADKWFLTGDANELENMNRRAPADTAMSTMSVAVPEIHTIKIDGGFTTQIYGSDGHDSVDLFGPNAGVSSITVDVMDDTLYVHVRPIPSAAITKVIVRIGVKHLAKLVQMGCGPIDVLQITSHKLDLISTPRSSGDIYLSGHVRLNEISQAGTGSMYVFGVNTPSMTIRTSGTCGSSVNLFGNVGVRSIVHQGANDINIIGANSPTLCIFATGAGRISIKGFVRLKKVETHDYTNVYVSQTSSQLIYADAFDCSTIGLTGSVGNLYTNTSNTSHFYGKTLCAQNVYATALNTSHMNITACNKAYARAYDSSSIYFFGPDYLVNRFERDKGVVVSMNERNYCNMASEYRAYDYTDMHRQAGKVYVGAG